MPSHFGPAVNRKPAKNSGMKPKPISNACACAGGRFHGHAQPAQRASIASAHHSALVASTSAAAANARRCGAANSHASRHGGADAGTRRGDAAGRLGRIGIWRILAS